MEPAFEIWIARCRTGPDAGDRATAAVWASSLDDCEALVKTSVLGKGLAWDGLDEARRLSELDDDERAALPLAALEQSLGPERRVLLRRPEGAEPPVNHVATPLPFPGPLDAQFGVWPPLTAPEDTLPHVFPGDGRHTYAVLDAGQIPGLFERLETSGLVFRCLYKGEMAEDMRDLAPYLVELAPDHTLCRALFTAGDGPLALWGRDFGAFVLSADDFDTLHAHLRKFTAVMDAKGDRRLFLKFWSSAALAAMARHKGPDPLISGLLAHGSFLFFDRARVSGPALIALSREGAA